MACKSNEGCVWNFNAKRRNITLALKFCQGKIFPKIGNGYIKEVILNIVGTIDQSIDLTRLSYIGFFACLTLLTISNYLH
jgi:hypothetical protein